MFENADTNSSPSQNNEFENSAQEFLGRAAQACSAGDAVLGMHLYLAAFEKATHGTYVPGDEAIDGLRQAWALACKLKERSLAEYIFEKLEPYLESDEIAACAEQLQRLALDKLEEFGLSREDLEDMTDMISQDFLGLEGARLVKVEHVTAPLRPARPEGASRNAPDDAPAANAGEPKGAPAAQRAAQGAAACGIRPAPSGDASPSEGAAGMEGAAPSGADAVPEGTKDAPSFGLRIPGAGLAKAMASSAQTGAGDEIDAPDLAFSFERLSYRDIVGFSEAVKSVRSIGIGMEKDPGFQDLVGLLNARHGLSRMPAADSLLFRSPAREDASRFMAATMGELGLPGIRMRMEENLQGMPILCVMAQADNQPKLNTARNEFEGPGVLLLEDLDLWGAPVPDGDDGLGGFILAQLSRGAREAINLIRSAVESPDVYVLASAAEGADIDPFFCDLLEPLTVIDIDYPTPAERVDIWMDIARNHPSVRGIDRAALVRYSAQLPRFDIYMAVREAIEEAYKAGLVAGRYVPVTAENLFEKLAAYQPLDSDEYRQLEEAVVRDFRRGLDDLDDLLKGTGE